MHRTGVFSGTFDPVHAGHIAFALDTIKTANLDEVYFLPEALPRRKEGVTHYAHRIAMLRLALKPYQKLKLLELPDKQFSMKKSLPRLKQKFPHDELYMLIGSDMLELITSIDVARQWPDHQRLIDNFRLIAGVRSDSDLSQAEGLMSSLQPDGIVIQSSRPYTSSSLIRRTLLQGKDHKELLTSLKPYIKKNWLYEAVPPSSQGK